MLNNDPKKPGRPPETGDNKTPKSILIMVVVALIFTVLINSLYETISNSRMERVVRERMTTQDVDGVTPQSLINIK
ncbi:MAG TPA: hypothetical protein IAA83_04835, partial [Candidatus Avoscillospira avistercoris]|nr:hypothetical protein [Candidatus Avoscillospira avistercoris]